MAFILIKGRFTPQFGQPDGDSVRFLANNRRLLLELEGRRPNISGSSLLGMIRYGGINRLNPYLVRDLID
jgi:hypothetical protein